MVRTMYLECSAWQLSDAHRRDMGQRRDPSLYYRLLQSIVSFLAYSRRLVYHIASSNPCAELKIGGRAYVRCIHLSLTMIYDTGSSEFKSYLAASGGSKCVLSPSVAAVNAREPQHSADRSRMCRVKSNKDTKSG